MDDDDNWFVFDEHYESGQTIDYHAGIINAKSQGIPIEATFGDPSGAQWISEFAQRGIYITPANKEVGTNFNSWVRFGIEKVSERLKQVPGRPLPFTLSSRINSNSNVPTLSERDVSAGVPSIFVFNTCRNTLREFETYRWKEKSVTQAQDLNEPDVPEKANDHCLMGDTLIDTTEGQVKIKDLVGKTGYLYSERGKVRRFYDVKKVGREQIYEIEFMDGRVVRCSSEHPFKLASADWCPASLLLPLDLIQSVTNVNSNVSREGLQTIFGRTLFKSWKQKIAQDSVDLFQRRDTKGLPYPSQGQKYIKQLYRQFGIKTNSFAPQPTYDFRKAYDPKEMDQQDKAARLSVARLLRGFDVSFRAWQNLMAKERKDKKKLLTLWQRVRYLYWDKVKVLPSQLQNESKTAQIKRITRKPYKRATYNLEVEDTHSYSIAGGIIVSNSMDALRYFAVSYKKKEPDYIAPRDDISNKNWSLR